MPHPSFTINSIRINIMFIRTKLSSNEEIKSISLIEVPITPIFQSVSPELFNKPSG